MILRFDSLHALNCPHNSFDVFSLGVIGSVSSCHGNVSSADCQSGGVFPSSNIWKRLYGLQKKSTTVFWEEFAMNLDRRDEV